ncbi:MAG: PQQ-binding-like beta-propeller repeat protein [Methyloversatilis sp.]|uniref:outer membrane protein assembly factor BamB family protein n=1 Tax=Methyloversatilis sp. TaxID=2569862 RepID=UPI0025F73A2F|nr:PQQ-binding-like beta-propeller repeat protein [Methyloversatilis sp.]MCR6665253.1 PQQ-binding-like beta-propeller repeat protein [Methyloversatilis sp.]
MLGAAPLAMAAAGDGNWTEYNGDKAGSRYLAGGKVNAQSVKSMKVAWRWAMPDNKIWQDNAELRTWVNQSTPLAIDGVLYSSSPMSMVSAIDGKTGKTLWTYDPKAYVEGTPPNLGFISRGVSYWADGEDKRILVGTGDGYLIALNAKTGKPIESWGDKGRIDMTKGLRRFVDRSLVALTSPPIVCGNTIVPSLAVLDSFAVGRAPMKNHPPGDIQAFDIRSGKRVWHFEQPPQEGQPGNETWEDGSWKTTGSANMWARPSCDEELGLVYLPFSTPTNDFYGGHRKGNGLFGESVVALNAKTGKIAWYQQIVHHGLWDYDLPTAPNLMDLTVNGKKVKALAQVTKQGFVFTFDRSTGAPVWPITEKPVPQSTVPGERSSLTQPFPSLPAPFVQQGVSEDDLIDLTPQLKEEAKKILSRYNYGPLYYPPTTDKAGTLQVPGVLGGASWAGAAHNPKTNVLYVPSFTIPFGIKLKKENEGVLRLHRHLGRRRRSARSAAVQAPFLHRHRDRHEHRQAPVARAGRQGPGRSPGDQGPEAGPRRRAARKLHRADRRRALPRTGRYELGARPVVARQCADHAGDRGREGALPVRARRAHR